MAQDEKDSESAKIEDMYVLPLVRRKQTPSIHDDMETAPYHEIPSMHEDDIKTVPFNEAPEISPESARGNIKQKRVTALNHYEVLLAPAIEQMNNGLISVVKADDAERKQENMLASLIVACNDLERNPSANVVDTVFADISTMVHEYVVYALRTLTELLTDVAPAEQRESMENAEFSGLQKRLIHDFRDEAKARAVSLGMERRVDVRVSELEENQGRAR